jgi:hypothetical protein
LVAVQGFGWPVALREAKYEVIFTSPGSTFFEVLHFSVKLSEKQK